MDRTRIPEASLIGLLAALATFCALEARGGQPYSIVGQSSSATAATGRRPLAERIKAANRPIRIAAEEELAPDQGLIPGLDDPNTVEREWIPGPAVVEFPTGGPEAIAVDEAGDDALPVGEPGVMPPPESTAIAARPTTGDDAGLVGEASTIETGEPATTAVADGSAATPDRLPADTAKAQATRVTPPRRTAARVTPQRREALLERLRSALADVPRPLGLVPAPARRQAAPRSAVARHPVPASSLPQPLTAVPATTPTDAAAPSEKLADATSSEEASNEASTTDGGDDLGTTLASTEAPPASDAPVADDAAATAATTEGADTATESAVVSRTTDEPEATADGGPTEDSFALLDAPTETAAAPASDLPSDSGATPTATAAPRPPRTTNQAQVHRNGGGQRSRASNSYQPSMTPLDRLQARLEQMPRALGLVPAPRPSMHAARSPGRRVATPTPGTGREAVVKAPAPAPAAATEPTPADGDLVAGDHPAEAPATDDGDETLAATELDPVDALDSIEATEVTDVDGSADPAGTLATEAGIEQDHLAALDGDGESTSATTSDARSVEDAGAAPDADGSAPSVDAPTLVTTSTAESTTPVPPTNAVAVDERQDTAVAKRSTPRRQAQRPTAPVVRRPIRDALGSALATMPRPFGLLPETEAVPQRRPAAGPANGAGAPRALATKSIAKRPLDGASTAGPDVARATVATPPAATPSDDATTLTSGDDAEDAETLADRGSDPGTPDDDGPEGSTGPEAFEAAPASVEVTVKSPEASTSLGERVTLHLTIRNPGTTAVSAVTPVVHFGPGLEPLGIRGRNGHFSADGSVMFDRLTELPAGESVELEIIAVCTGTGTIPYRGVAWCGDGEEREIVPADASVTVTPTSVAAEPNGTRHR